MFYREENGNAQRKFNKQQIRLKIYNIPVSVVVRRNVNVFEPNVF